MKKKYFFFDIDGTLTDIKTNQIVPSALVAIKQLKNAGHFVALASGRAQYKSVPIMKELGIENMVANGGNSLTINNELVQNIPLDKTICLDVLRQAEDQGWGYLLALDNSINVFSKDNLFVRQMGLRKEPTRYLIDQNLVLDRQDIYKIYLAIKPEDEDQIDHLNDLGHIRFKGDYLIFQPDNKANGIKAMIDYLGASYQDVVVFGDDVNDIIMFQEPWYKIAMGNGCLEVKELADYVARMNTEDGIYLACKDHKWI